MYQVVPMPCCDHRSIQDLSVGTDLPLLLLGIVEDDCLPRCVNATLSVCILAQNLLSGCLSVCLAVWLTVSWLVVPPGWLHHLTSYPPHSQ